jgi:NAD(P)-dependent dehydrogenase (short-subunit alcohol dehydrogenase family)
MSFLEETKADILKDSPKATIRLVLCDLASQNSVRKAAADILGYPESFNVLINSAGIMASPYAKTADGIESQFGINHIGKFLLLTVPLFIVSLRHLTLLRALPFNQSHIAKTQQERMHSKC